MGFLQSLFLLWVVCLAKAGRPNIVFIVADDLGWNDLGIRNPDMITPNLDRLAREGMILNQSYVLPVCSPSRTAFMTGVYPFKTGQQHYVIDSLQPVCVPYKFTFLPQELKKLGYSTHAIGKWHLGFCNWNCTPTFRGFDTFFGYYGGGEDYFSHETGGYLDFRDNKMAAVSYNGSYSTEVFSKRAVDVIRNHDTSKPLFLYLPFQAVHAPIEVPQKYENMYPHVVNKGRRKFCGMVSALDEGVGDIVKALMKSDLYNNTLIVFTADNGGELVAYANNWPLRGGKHTLWEGGTRASGFVHGVGLTRTGITYPGMIHAVDWFPTLLSAAGGKASEDIDGMDQWPALRSGSPTTRTEFVYNLDNFHPASQGHAAIRWSDYKLILGYPGLIDGYYKPMNNTKDTPLFDLIYREGDYQALLFNVKEDPLEQYDLSEKLPDVTSLLRQKVEAYRGQMVPAAFPRFDPHGNPKYFHDVWSPGWC